VRSWYNGYLFGGTVIYNPWSVLNFATSTDRIARPHWLSTSSNDVLRKLVTGHGGFLLEEMEHLLSGGTLEKVIEENVVLRDIERKVSATYGLLLFSGYLKPQEVLAGDGNPLVRLAIPNREVRVAFSDTVMGWLEESAVRAGVKVDGLVAAMLAGDVSSFEGYLSDLVVSALSYQDTGGREPERVYQAFVLGLLAHLEPRYRVRSNRESGYGRHDVAVTPARPGEPGVVIEFKRVDTARGETLDAALDSALRQIADRRHGDELLAAGASPVRAYAVAFDGKRVHVRAG
jgi:hypothetical protein